MFLLLLLTSLMTNRAETAENLLTNPGFEYGNTSGWTDWGCDLSASTAQVFTGSYSGYAYNRGESWQGFVQSLLGVMEDGKTYSISGWVRLQNASSDNIGITIQQTDSSGTNYHSVSSLTGYNDQWVQLTGFFTLDVNGSLSALNVYYEKPAASVNFYLDDAEVVEQSGSDWETDANDRIEQYRKRDVQITVVSPTGQSVPDVNVQIRQTKHHFAFGTCIAHWALDNYSDYRNFIPDHFEWAVCENETKWGSNEDTRDDEDYNDADYIYDWCNDNGIIMRGHTLFWEQLTYVQSWVKSLSYPSELLTEVDERIDSAVNHFKNKFVHWDVDNEILSTGPDYEFYNRIGEEGRVHMFQRANTVDPNCKLYMNEYSGNSFGGYDGWTYASRANSLISMGAPIHGLGIQGHIEYNFNPQLYYNNVLVPLATVGLPIMVTEFDIPQADENLRANELEEYYRICFSHPSVEGILMWGFWEDAAWRWEGILNSDWTLNAAGVRYEQLLDEWTTDVNCITDPNGQADFRGFHGTYEITLTHPSTTTIVRTVQLEPDPNTAEFIFTVACPGDFEPDGDVDFADFCFLAQSWKCVEGHANYNPVCDISDPNDNCIDECDLAVFTDYWQTGE